MRGGFWHAGTDSYRLIWTGDGGDTVVVIEAGPPVRPVPDADRSAHVEELVERHPEERRGIEAAAALAWCGRH